MSYTLYQVSKENKVTVFTQNQKAPNKVGESLCEKIEELLMQGESFETVKEIIIQEYNTIKSKNIRGINSVNLSFSNPTHSSIQEHKSLYLSYKLNGTFCTFTEYEAPVRKEVAL